MECKTEALGSMIHMSWPELGILAELANIRYNRDRDATAIITVRAPLGNSHAVEIFQGRVNLMGPRAQSDLIRTLKERYEAEWINIVPTMCYQGNKLLSVGEETTPIRYRADLEPPKYLLYPALALDRPNIIYGVGASGKSILASAIAVVVASGFKGNPLRLEPMYDQANVLILDYEADKAEYEWRCNCIMRGMDMPPETFEEDGFMGTCIDYRHMSIPIADDIEAINRQTLERDYKLIIIDSIAASVGGDLNLTDGPNRLFPALRQLKTTVLLIGHVAKNAKGETTPYGNAFFFNYARSIWELKKVQEADDESLFLGLFHRKANASKLHSKIGFSLSFGEDWVKFQRSRLSDIPGFEDDLSMTEKIRLWLSKNGKAEIKAIANGIDAKETTVKTTLWRMRQKGQVTHFDDGWALLSNVTVTPL